MVGPETECAQQLHAEKYRNNGENFDDYAVRFARVAYDKHLDKKQNDKHFRDLLAALRSQRILPAGRQQLAVGRPQKVTVANCFVGPIIEDSIEGIYEALKLGAMTLRTGGGVGWSFSSLRPKGDPIRGLGFKAYASGPVSFMHSWDAMCTTIMSAGRRRGAMMGILSCHHPDVLLFIKEKSNTNLLTNFNISVAITDEFMEALQAKRTYQLRFNGQSYSEADAESVWASIMENNWDYSEPGVIFIDQMNRMNPLNYCEEIVATNPCSEIPLPPHGICLLGSINIVKYLIPDTSSIAQVEPDEFGTIKLVRGHYTLDFDLFKQDVETAVRAFDNVIDIGTYPLKEQQEEEKAKRRMGVGVTGMANALEICGYEYGSPSYLEMQDMVLELLRDTVYDTSIQLSKEKGAFPVFDADLWLNTKFANTLPEDIRGQIKKHGLRNGVLLAIAPTGTISLCADNVSSGIEPPYLLEVSRTIKGEDGDRKVVLKDWAFREYGIKGLTAHEVTPKQHIDTLCRAQKYMDQAISKTCNVRGVRGTGEQKEDGQIVFEEFKDLYLMAYNGGAKSCSTHNMNGKRRGILEATETSSIDQSCSVDEEIGMKTCDI